MKNFVNKIVTLDNIRQWEERDSVIKETVSQHSFKVSAICVYLLERIGKAKTLNDNWRWSVFCFECTKYAILHDFDESVLGRDISHVVKYNALNGVKIREVLSTFVEHELDRLNLQFIYKDIEPDVKAFVKLCDWLAMLTFICRNKRMGVIDFCKEEYYCREKGEESLANVKSILLNKFEEIEKKDLEFFDNLINEVYGEG